MHRLQIIPGIHKHPVGVDVEYIVPADGEGYARPPDYPLSSSVAFFPDLPVGGQAGAGGIPTCAGLGPA